MRGASPLVKAARIILGLTLLSVPSINRVWGKNHPKPPSPETSIIVEKNLFSKERRYVPLPKEKEKSHDPWEKRFRREVLLYGVYRVGRGKKALLKISHDLANKWDLPTDSRGFIRAGPGESLGNYTVAEIGNDSILLKGEGKEVTLKLADPEAKKRAVPHHLSAYPKKSKLHRAKNRKKRPTNTISRKR